MWTKNSNVGIENKVNRSILSGAAARTGTVRG